MRNKYLRGFAVGIAALLIAGGLQALHLFRGLEWKTWDARSRIFADPARAGRDIVLVLVDQYSLDVFKKQQGLAWPWPRELYAALIRYLKSGGAAACFFDIAMTDDSLRGIEDDRQLAKAMVEAGNVVFPVALSTEEKESDEAAIGLLGRFSLKAPPPALAGDVYRSITTPLTMFLDAARGVGNVLVNPDDDGIYRRMPLSYKFRTMIVPAVPWAIEDLALGGPAAPSIPVDETGQMIIRFRGPTGTYRTYPAATLVNSWAQIQEGLKPQIPPEEFAGKIVLIGLSAVGLYDLKSSPTSAVMPGVEIQAAALDTLRHRGFVRTVPAVPTLVFILALTALAGIAVSSIRKTPLIVLAFALFLSVPAVAAWAAFNAGHWLEFVFPEAAVLLTLIGASVLNYSIEGKERRFIKGVFSHYLSPAVIDKLIEDPKRLRLGGEEREITSFFSDVAGFTSISEKLSPQDLVALLNAYLSEMTDIILNAGGTLDKYEGDAIVAFWNAPLNVPDHALQACRAALTCRKRLLEIGPDLEKRFGHRLGMRIGLNSGRAVVGNMGSGRRFDYTAMGDTINLAARLEGAGKQYKVTILAGEKTWERAKDGIVGREVDLIRVMGKAQPVRIYELLGETGELPPVEIDRIQAYHDALGVFRERRWERAIGAFEALGEDVLAGLYVQRARAFLSNPPAEDWDGVVELKTK